MARVSVQPELLRWALNRSGLSADDAEIRFPKFAGWESGEAQPTLKQLEKFAAATRTPLGFFFLDKPPDLPLPINDFRTVGNRRPRAPSPDLLDSIYTMQRRQEWLRSYLVESGAEPLDFVGSVQVTSDPVTAAGLIRQVLKVGLNWAQGFPTWSDALRELRGLIEEARIVPILNGVVGNNTHRKLDPQEFRGFSLVDDYAPLIFVNSADAKAAQMFTIAHELAHLWVGAEGVSNLNKTLPTNSTIEEFCNKVAAEFLVPASVLTEIWATVSQATDPFQELARRFKVSPIVAARRALDLRLISRNRFFQFYEQSESDEQRVRGKQTAGGDFYATQNTRVGRRFVKLVSRAAHEGKLLYRDAYSLTGLSGATFDQYVKSLP